jgi:hypothetical protein
MKKSVLRFVDYQWIAGTLANNGKDEFNASIVVYDFFSPSLCLAYLSTL